MNSLEIPKLHIIFPWLTSSLIPRVK